MQTDHPKLMGYSANGTCELNSVQEVAEFICQEGIYGDLTILTEEGDFFLNTFGTFIDRIADMDYRQELLEVLIPMQMELEGSMGGLSIACPSRSAALSLKSITVSGLLPGLPSAILSAIAFFGLPPEPGLGPLWPMFSHLLCAGVYSP